MDLVDRARAYVGKMEGSVSGSGGHVALMKAASALVVGFNFADELALSILREVYNPKCAPVWSERELIHKVTQARTHAQGEFGALVGKQSERSDARSPARASQGANPEPERPRKRQEFDAAALKAMMCRGFNPGYTWLAERSPMEPREVTSGGFLDAIFEPGEKTLAFMRFTSQGEMGHVAGAPGKIYRIGARPGHPPVLTDSYPLSAREGMWFLPCPLDGKWYPTGQVDDQGNPVLSRRTGRSVTCYRQLLLESDKADEMDWLNLLCQLPLPISALTRAGGARSMRWSAWRVILRGNSTRFEIVFRPCCRSWVLMRRRSQR